MFKEKEENLLVQSIVDVKI